MRALRLAVAALAAAAAPGAAQSVSPLIAEYDRPSNGWFEVQNPGLYPVTVVVEARGFDLAPDGVPTFGALPHGVEVRLSETSFQVAPQGRHTVFYEVSAPHPPAWFTIYSTLTGPRPASGVQLRVQLPHTVYVYGSALRPEDVVVEAVRFEPGAREVLVDLANASERLGRVGLLRVESAGADAEHAGFPLLPGKRRTIRVPWAQDTPPETVVLEFEGFRVTHDVVAGVAATAPRR